MPPELVFGAIGLPPRMRRPACPARRLHPCLGNRPDSRRRRQLPGPRGQRPDSLGRELRPQEPAGDEAGLSAALSSNTTCGRSTTTPTTCWPCCARSRRRAATIPTVVVLTPGHLQLGLLRAQFPGPADGGRAGRGARPGPRPGPDLQADHARAATGRRDLPPGGRRFSRSARPFARTACSASPG